MEGEGRAAYPASRPGCSLLDQRSRQKTRREHRRRGDRDTSNPRSSSRCLWSESHRGHSAGSRSRSVLVRVLYQYVPGQTLGCAAMGNGACRCLPIGHTGVLVDYRKFYWVR